MKKEDIEALKKNVGKFVSVQRTELNRRADRLDAINASREAGAGINITLGDVVDLAKKEIDKFLGG